MKADMEAGEAKFLEGFQEGFKRARKVGQAALQAALEAHAQEIADLESHHRDVVDRAYRGGLGDGYDMCATGEPPPYAVGSADDSPLLQGR